MSWVTMLILNGFLLVVQSLCYLFYRYQIMSNLTQDSLLQAVYMYCLVYVHTCCQALSLCT